MFNFEAGRLLEVDSAISALYEELESCDEARSAEIQEEFSSLWAEQSSLRDSLGEDVIGLQGYRGGPA